MKNCALVVGLHGLLRVSEMANLRCEDVKEEDDGDFVIKVTASKTDQRKGGWFYRVTGGDAKYVKEYVRSLPEEAKKGRFFKRPLKTKRRFAAQPVGKNTLGSIPRLIARLLKRKDERSFSGHSFRRTGATILADTGVSRLILKRAGRWQSDTVAEGYLAQSLSSKNTISNAVGAGVIHRDQAEGGGKDSKSRVINNIYVNNNGDLTIHL